MKRRFTYLLLALALCFTLLLPLVTAQGAGESHVRDEAQILDVDEQTALEEKARALSEEYDCDFYILTVYDYWDYGETPYQAACNYFIDNDLGRGEDGDGIILMLSMRDRDYALAGHGIGDTAFTDAGIDHVEEGFLPEFRRNDWKAGFEAYLSCSGECVAAARNGTPMKEKLFGFLFDGLFGVAVTLGMVVGFPLVVALMICAVWKGQMKSVRKGVEAKTYLIPGSESFSVREDTFTHSTQVRYRIERDHSSSGGGGGSHSHGGGFSGSSGKF